MYDVGYRLGRTWAVREATEDQLQKVYGLKDGRAWTLERDDPYGDLRHLIDPENTGFLELDEPPAQSFIAGFIDGSKSLE